MQTLLTKGKKGMYGIERNPENIKRVLHYSGKYDMISLRNGHLFMWSVHIQAGMWQGQGIRRRIWQAWTMINTIL